MKKIMNVKYSCIMCLLLLVALTGILVGCAATKEVRRQDDMPKLCEQQLKSCFGEDYTISDGMEKEEHFFEEHSKVEIITYYTEWDLTYKDADGREQVFTFNNSYGRGQPEERMESFIENYFSDLVQEHYKEKFWNDITERIPACRKADSVLYFQGYRLFLHVDMPETSAMFEERANYSLTDNVYFPSLKYTDVCIDFPYTLNLYLYVDYKSDDAAKRMAQRNETEKILRETLDAMIQYTDESLNARAYVIMMDENGFADDFSLAVLDGEYFENGSRIDYEKALHENFYSE